MKYNLENKRNRFAQRTLADFSNGLLNLMCKKRFEEITVQELCENCNYPRATFYNYFEDIYDLLNYCWMAFANELNLESCEQVEEDKILYTTFEQVYDLLDEKRLLIDAILKKNLGHGKMLDSFQTYLHQQIFIMMSRCKQAPNYQIPYEIVAEHYSNTTLLILEWCFIKKKFESKEEALACLEFILGDLQNKLICEGEEDKQ